MIKPNQIKKLAGAKDIENDILVYVVEQNATADKLDKDCHELYEKYAKKIDCKRCRNCCKKYTLYLKDDEIEKIAAFLGMKPDAFHRKYLRKAELKIGLGRTDETKYMTKTKGGPFLDGKTGNCTIEEVRPEACADFPFIDLPNRIKNMSKVTRFAQTCPISYEVVEELKIIYHLSDYYSEEEEEEEEIDTDALIEKMIEGRTEDMSQAERWKVVQAIQEIYGKEFLIENGYGRLVRDYDD